MGRISRFLFLIFAIGMLGAMAYIAFTDLPAPKTIVIQKIDHDI